jgi:hypothetical protein
MEQIVLGWRLRFSNTLLPLARLTRRELSFPYGTDILPIYLQAQEQRIRVSANSYLNGKPVGSPTTSKMRQAKSSVLSATIVWCAPALNPVRLAHRTALHCARMSASGDDARLDDFDERHYRHLFDLATSAVCHGPAWPVTFAACTASDREYRCSMTTAPTVAEYVSADKTKASAGS